MQRVTWIPTDDGVVILQGKLDSEHVKVNMADGHTYQQFVMMSGIDESEDNNGKVINGVREVK